MKIEFIKPEKVFSESEILCCVTSNREGFSEYPYGLNMSFKVNDNAENVIKNREEVYKALGISGNRIVLQKQVHSDIVTYADKSGLIESSDALITDKKNLFLTLSVADCYPVFIADSSERIIAAVHSGWRGTEKNISGNTISEIRKRFGIDTRNLQAYIGPGICVNHFEVGKEVYERFPDEVRKKTDGKYFVDLRKNILLQLLDSGIKPENIEVCNLCTYEENSLLHSYRRDKEKSGRMFGFIGLLR
jgi:YfiH family protein